MTNPLQRANNVTALASTTRFGIFAYAKINGYGLPALQNSVFFSGLWTIATLLPAKHQSVIN